ncbi:PAS domain S-box protein [Phenylobacterium sp.]|uniref:PAS domain-containing hybrid sensor histidine kinase/response regulator n=1 Tax=Phenylobacterium sp. TaxID=1871053 RepID=UPI00286C18A6|nr:PAS domain S-box protein [Phenylobacterium sp.]
MIQWLFENSREVMFVIGQDKCFELVNPAFERETGWTEAEILGRPAREIIHSGDIGEVEAHLARLAAFGFSDNASRVLMKDGSFRWFDGRAQLTEDGRIIGVVRDATAEREREAALAEAEQTRIMLSTTAGIGTWTYESDGDRVEWSQDILNITGYQAGDISDSHSFEAILHPDDLAAVQAAFISGIVNGKSQGFEHRMRAKDGRWTSWRVTFHAEPRPSGAYALKGVSQDITELVQARDAALRSEQQIRQLIESAPFSVAMFDKDLRYMVVSGSWREAFKLADREHIGLSMKTVFPTAPKRLTRAQDRALAGEVVSCKEDRFTDSQGTRHWVRWDARPWRDTDGQVQGVICYVDDISVQAQARQEAQAAARRLKLALDAAEAGVYEIDHVHKTFWASPEFKKLVGSQGATYDEAVALNYPRFHSDDLDQVRSAFGEIRDGKRVAGEAFEARAVTDDGQERWIRVFHHLKTDRKGKWLKGVGLVQDFDARKRQELDLIEAQRAAQAASEAKAAFLANMSHEICTPMNGVMGVLHLLKSEALSSDGRKMLEEALSCGQMLAELLNDVIDFSKIEAGRLELACEPVDPRALIEGVARLLRPQAQAKGLALNVEIADDLGWVRTDPVRLRQALFNLIGNAVKFTLKGQVTVRASLKAGPSEPVLRLEVADTGIGIPEAVQPRIFQRFDQGDASTTRQFGGSGLGLTITQRLAEILGGGVGFASTQGVGSIFWLEVAAPVAEAAVAEIEAAEPYLEGLRVLVVEDNATNRMIVTKLLENLGAVVQTAADGLLGVEAAAVGGFDLILMDVQMPGIDGLEASRRIRALGGPVASTPIVALTANVLSHQRQAYLEAGMDGVVGKPISPSALLAEIARLSGTMPAADEAAA